MYTIAARMSSVNQELLYLIFVFPKVLEIPALVEGIDLIIIIINKRTVIIPITWVRTAIDPPPQPVRIVVRLYIDRCFIHVISTFNNSVDSLIWILRRKAHYL